MTPYTRGLILSIYFFPILTQRNTPVYLGGLYYQYIFFPILTQRNTPVYLGGLYYQYIKLYILINYKTVSSDCQNATSVLVAYILLLLLHIYLYGMAHISSLNMCTLFRYRTDPFSNLFA